MKRGFTLIELLAVIVILGIIATISTIAVDKTIKENKQKLYEAQIASLEDGARTWAAKHISQVPDNNGEAISVPLSELKKEGIIASDFENPKTNKPFNDDFYVNISYEGGIYKYEAAKTSGLGIDANPTLLNRRYYLPIQELCKPVTESTKTTGNLPKDNFAYGDEYTCELGDNDTKTFFVLEQKDDLVSLIMNANVGNDGKAITSASTDKGLVAWVTKEDYIAAGGTEDAYDKETNKYGPITARKTLKTNTNTWTKIEQYQTTLPTYDQINGAYTGSMPAWLYDYLDGTTNSVTNVYGYWTASSLVGTDSKYSSFAWVVYCDGGIYRDFCSISADSGVRPVITFSKS